MTYPFLAAFAAGLLLGVHVMMHGVEKVRSALPIRPAPGARYPASLLRPALAGFLACFGLAGNLAHRGAERPSLAGIAVAIVAGVLGAWASVVLVTRWAIPSALADVVDERFVLMGHFARVTAPIGGGDGSVTYEVDGVTHSVPARALEDGTAIAAGTDVVIERIENGVAFVEPWSQVEQRI